MPQLGAAPARGPATLTERQRRVLEAIAATTAGEGRPPTLREIGRRLEIASTNGVRDHLQALARKGYIRRDPYSARGIRLLRTADGREIVPSPTSPPSPVPRRLPRATRPVREAPPPPVAVRVPVVGRVAAGEPILAEQNVDDYLMLDGGVIKDGDVFALRVRGDSMRDAGILDGDYVFIRPQSSAQPRDIVVALIGDETTVKRYVPAGDLVRLEPENPAHQPILVRLDDPTVRILGRVSAVLRTI